MHFCPNYGIYYHQILNRELSQRYINIPFYFYRQFLSLIISFQLKSVMTDKQRFLFRVQKCQDQQRPPTIYFSSKSNSNTICNRTTKSAEQVKNIRKVPEIYLEASNYYHFKVTKYDDDDTVPSVKHSQTEKKYSIQSQNTQTQQKILKPNKYLNKYKNKENTGPAPTIYFDKDDQAHKMNYQLNRNKQQFKVTKYGSQVSAPSVFFDSQIRKKCLSDPRQTKSRKVQTPSKKQFQFRVSSRQKERSPNVRFNDKGSMKIQSYAQNRFGEFSFKVNDYQESSIVPTIRFSQTLSFFGFENKAQKNNTRNSQLSSFNDRQNNWIPTQQIYETKTVINKIMNKQSSQNETTYYPGQNKGPAFNLHAKKQNKLYSKKLQTLMNSLSKDSQEMQLSNLDSNQNNSKNFIVPSNIDLNKTSPIKLTKQKELKINKTVEPFKIYQTENSNIIDQQSKFQQLKSDLLQQKLSKTHKTHRRPSNEKKMKQSFLNQLNSIEIQIKGLLQQTHLIARSIKGEQQSDNDQFEQLSQSKYQPDDKKQYTASTLKNSSYNQSYKLRSSSINRSKRNTNY